MTRSNARRGAASVAAAAGAVALALGAAAPASAGVDPTTGDITIDLLSITDFHGALASAPNITAQVNAFRAANEGDTLFSSAGDSIGGSTFESAIDRDFPTLDLLDAAELDVSTVGNHEFDQGFDDLVNRVQPDVEFPYLGANVIDDLTGEPALPPIEIIATASGATVAYIGTVTQQTPSVVSPRAVEGLTFLDPVQVTNEWADLLSDGVDEPGNPEADVVVALAHEGTGVMAPGLNEHVDVAFTGHSHQQTIDATASGAPVIQSGASGTHLGHVRVTIDGASGDVSTSGAENLTVTELTQEQIESTTPLPAEQFDATSVAIVREAFAFAATEGDVEVGRIDAPFNAASNSGAPNVGTPQHRGAESPLGNLLAEVYVQTIRDFGNEVDFGIMNPGGVRADLDPNEDGIVSYREAFNVTPFGNTIGTVDLTGAQVLTLLEQQFEPRAPRPMLALGLSELSFLYDPAAPIGSRVIAAYVGPEESATAIDPDAIYTVASNTFLLEGGDGFTVLGEGTNLQETGVVDAQAFQDFLAAESPLAPTYRQQSIGVTVVSDLSRAIAPGEEVTVELSSLSFTSTEPKPQTVTAAVVGSNLSLPAATTVDGAGIAAESDLVQPAAAPGTVLATAEVDDANVLDSNETGRATVTFAVPGDTVDGQLFVAFVASGEGLPDSDPVVLEFTVDRAAVPPTQAPPPSTTAPAPSPTTPPAAGGSQGTLPQTGAELAGPAVALAVLLLALGLGLVLRRRRTA